MCHSAPLGCSQNPRRKAVGRISGEEDVKKYNHWVNAVVPVSLIAMASCSASVRAQEASADEESVLVLAQRTVVRNHVQDTAPKLVYDASYFERYEPLSVGDMLKRVPGVTFNSDVGEYDLPRLRGLDSRYTQVLINGRTLPGSANDGAIAVDRIPAEMISRIEIIRSPSSDIASNGVGGTLNIVLKDGARYQGGIWRLGALHMEQTRANGFLGYAGSNGKLDYGFSLNVQERYNPKAKTSSELDGDEREDVREADVRDSRDLALDGDLAWNFNSGNRASVKLYVMDTEREEEELAQVDGFVRDSADAAFALDESVNEHQLEDISQRNYAVNADYTVTGGALESVWYGGWQAFREDKTETNSAADTGSVLALEDSEVLYLDDTRLHGGVKWVYERRSFEARFGGEYQQSERDFRLATYNDEGELDQENDEYSDFEAQIAQTALFAVGQWQLAEKWEFEAGLRGEHRARDLLGRNFIGATSRQSTDDTQWNPALHLRWNASAADQFRLSLARTLLRPQFDQLNPVELTIDDEKFRGNPELKPESSWGIDAGYDHFIGDSAVLGLNGFYRRVNDLIEYTQVELEQGGDTFDQRMPVNNRNTGTVYGAELDLSVPATWLGLAEMQWYVNVTLLNSRVEDAYFAGYHRRFSGQANYVYNLGFEHALNTWNISYGASYQQQGDSAEYEGEELNRIHYDGNLELFVEKHFAGGKYLVRLAGQNLLDAEKREWKREYDDTGALRAGTTATSEVELESTEPAILLTLRGRL